MCNHSLHYIKSVTILLYNFLKGIKTMTQNEFYNECTKLTIYPLVAMENEKIKQALRQRDDKKVLKLLTTEF